ncbi:MAG: amidohydrolase, partial [Planctomycetes bacterium]|nr:amidohydrolase [Planctomycetota bacterium]
MLKIDIHTHILPPKWPDLAEKYGYGRWVSLVQQHDATGACCGGRMLIDGEPFRDVKLNCFDHAVRLEECDSLGVDVQVLSTVPIM